MKYSEYKKIAEKHEWEIDNSYAHWLYADKTGVRIVIDKTRTEVLEIITYDELFSIFEEKEFIKACYEFAETSIRDRRDEKEYYLRHIFLSGGNHESHNYLNMHVAGGRFFLSSKVSENKHKTRFTESDMDKVEDMGVDLRDFELVEVVTE